MTDKTSEAAALALYKRDNLKWAEERGVTLSPWDETFDADKEFYRRYAETAVSAARPIIEAEFGIRMSEALDSRISDVNGREGEWTSYREGKIDGLCAAMVLLERAARDRETDG